MPTLTNNDDPDSWVYTICFDKTDLQRKKSKFYLEIITYDLSIYTMDHPKFLHQKRRKNPLVHKGLRNFQSVTWQIWFYSPSRKYNGSTYCMQIFNVIARLYSLAGRIEQ